MSLKKFVLLTFAVTALWGGHAGAQSLRDAPIPAEFPHSSYDGRQYVDSNGCVFVRAGVAGNVSWVPRMTRDREPLCGFQPSLTARAAPEAAPAPRQQAAPVPRQQAAAPSQRAVAVAATPRTTPQAQNPRPTATPARTIRRASAPAETTAAPAPRPQPVESAAPTTTPQAQRARVITPPDPSRSACANATGVSAAYMVQHNGSPVRCGPQRTAHVTYVTGGNGRFESSTAPAPGTVATPDTVPPRTRVAPRKIYESQQRSLAGVYVPQGMKPVWEDDRLNPQRAHQTFEGKARMEVMWTNTVPRRLIDRRTGRDVIHKYPGLQPPFTSFEDQRAAGVRVATQGRVLSDPQTVRRGTTVTRTAAAQSAGNTTVSTRSAPEAVPSASHRYAQAGIFADPAQGKAAAQKIARTGLPARRGTLSRDGRELTLVLAGPFQTQTQLDRGVARLQGLGFSNVRLRK